VRQFFEELLLFIFRITLSFFSDKGPIFKNDLKIDFQNPFLSKQRVF